MSVLRRKSLILFSLSLLLLFAFFGCSDEPYEEQIKIHVEKVEIECSTPTVARGYTLDLKIKITPDDATDKSLKWTSSDEKIATVDKNGRVKGVSIGFATITATSVSDAEKKAEVKIEVVEPEGTLKAMVVSGEHTTFPSDWFVEVVKTDGEVLARLDANNTVVEKDLLEGAYEISFNSNLGNYDISLSSEDTTSDVLNINIKNDEVTEIKVNIGMIPVESVSLSKSRLAMDIGDSYSLCATVMPENATNKDVTWTSDNPEVANVDENGVVNGFAKGKAKITASSAYDPALIDVCEIEVLTPVEGIAVNAVSSANSLPDGWSVEVKAGDIVIGKLDENAMQISKDIEEGVYNITINPVGLDNYNVSVNQAQVSVKKGTPVDITVNIKTIPVTGIDLTMSEGAITSICEGESFSVSADVYPNNATDKSIVWTSSNSDVATVDKNGKVTGLSKGEATIKASSSNIEIYKEFNVTVDWQRGNLTVNVDYGKLNLPEGWAIDVKDGGTLLGTLSESNKPLQITGLVVAEHDITLEPTGLDRYEVISSHPDGVQINKGRTTVIKVTISEIPVNSISLASSNGSNSLDVDNQLTLIPIIMPSNATVTDVTWASSNDKVATVEDGVVRGIAEGTAKITATSVYDSTKKGSFDVNVALPIGRLHMAVNIDSSLTLPSGWSIELDSDDMRLETFNEKNKGSLSRDLAVGEYPITISPVGLDNYEVTLDKKSASITKGGDESITITIAKRPVESLSLEPSVSGSINLGDTLTLTPSIVPSNATVQTITWTSSNESVAKVDENGVVTTQGTPGNAEIKAEVDGKSTTYTLTVDDEIAISGRAQVLPYNFMSGANVIDSSGITVTIEGTELTATTGSAGYFEFSDVPRGKVTFVFTEGTTSYGRDTFDYSDATTTQRPQGMMLLSITEPKKEYNDVPYGVVGYGSQGMWRVLDRVDNKALFVSSRVIEEHTYSAEASTWDKSDLKFYLNGDFYNKNFTDTQKKYIVDEGYGKVFVLSTDEAKKYFSDDNDRIGTNLQGENYKGWWLRDDTTSTKVSYVSKMGVVHTDNQHQYNDLNGVRPAIWVKLGN